MKVTILIYFTVICLLVNLAKSNYVIYSPRITNWGSWGPFNYCPVGKYVNGMRLKVEPIRKTGLFGYSDNTALNAVELLCGDIGKPINHHNSTIIFSSEGRYGEWGSKLFCPENTFVVGFQLRSERPRGTNIFSWLFGANSKDDTAANNLRLFCSEKSNYIEGYGTSEGYWTSSQHCLERQAICGFRTQVEPYQNKGDDTELNNIDMVCCDIPNPAKNCTPEETWDVVKECDNTRGVTDLSCNYMKKIGITHSKVATKADTESYSNLGFNTGSVGSMLLSNFDTGASTDPHPNLPGNIWSTSSYEIKSEETVHGLTFTVPPGYKSELLQVVGTCGIYSIRTPKFIRSDTNVLNETSVHEMEAQNNII